MITNETTIFNDIRRNIKLQRKYKPKYSKIFFRQIWNEYIWNKIKFCNRNIEK